MGASEATGHAQHRSWRRRCVAGRAVGQQHRTRSEEQKAKSLLLTVALDYTFPEAVWRTSE